MTGFVEVSQNEMMAVDGGISPAAAKTITEVLIGVTVELIVNTCTIIGDMIDAAIENAKSNTSNSSGGISNGGTYIDTAKSNTSNSSGGISNGGTYIDTAYTPSGTYA